MRVLMMPLCSRSKVVVLTHLNDDLMTGCATVDKASPCLQLRVFFVYLLHPQSLLP